MWQDSIVYAIVALVAGLAAWRIYRMFTGRASGCGGCAGQGSSCCGSGNGAASGSALRPLTGPGCGCGH
ncbi:MAG: FeoB-associated Cys-rich membrane protein [Humidesulfovibrio sp.]|nr:hypothetical protein [Desulfovibrio sp.]MDO9082793.1 FeoB-associated Cys-rich membrane protein [Humidesulfovibrio sp.]